MYIRHRKTNRYNPSEIEFTVFTDGYLSYFTWRVYYFLGNHDAISPTAQ
ncbi:MAG: hypothetical protein ACE14V_10955 [bacterium]